MPRNRKANRPEGPRYETPDPGQLPTPKQTPGVGSSARKGPWRSQERLEQERQEREIRELDESIKERVKKYRERGGDTDDEFELGIGPWEAKGNLVGYLDSEDEEMLNEWSRENESEMFCKMGVEKWKTVAMFLLEHVVRLVEGVAILGKDGSVAFEGRDELSEKIASIIGEREGLQSEIDDLGDKVGELLQELAPVEENLDLKKQLLNAQLARFEAETKWKQWAEREVQGKREEAETGAEEGSKKEREQQLEKEIQVRAGKLVAVERKKWQAKGKARSIETIWSRKRGDFRWKLRFRQRKRSRHR
ncbi:hypothetical protein EV426DRAFT_629128 [Tirmania nivea]|nr:hypothetical protein EV426DRAFT_629128 [Tirmania nivea]